MPFRITNIILPSVVFVLVCLSIVSAAPIDLQIPLEAQGSAEQECIYICSYLPGYVPQPSMYLDGQISCVYYNPIVEQTCIYRTTDGTSDDPNCEGELQVMCVQAKRTFGSTTPNDVQRRLEGRQWSAAKERAKARERDAARRKDRCL